MRAWLKGTLQQQVCWVRISSKSGQVTSAAPPAAALGLLAWLYAAACVGRAAVLSCSLEQTAGTPQLEHAHAYRNVGQVGRRLCFVQLLLAAVEEANALFLLADIAIGMDAFKL